MFETLSEVTGIKSEEYKEIEKSGLERTKIIKLFCFPVTILHANTTIRNFCPYYMALLLLEP